MSNEEILFKYLDARDTFDSSTSTAINKSIKIITNAIRLYGMNKLAISFNGGKDACVVLHLIRYVLNSQGRLHELNTVYFHHDDVFPEMTEFLSLQIKRYNLRMITYNCSYKEGMINFVNGGFAGVFMGVRKGDPYVDEDGPFQPSSVDWPPFMRIYPILTWEYNQVWDFLRNAGLPYCKLYDQGYTSIGYITNTFPNPALQLSNQQYLPAYLLTDNSLERQGSRVSSSNATSTSSKTTSTTIESMDTIICQTTTHTSEILTNTLPSKTTSISVLLLYDDCTDTSSLSHIIPLLYDLCTESSPQLLIHEILLYRNNNESIDKLEDDNSFNTINGNIGSRINTLAGNSHRVLVIQDKEYIMQGKLKEPKESVSETVTFVDQINITAAATSAISATSTATRTAACTTLPPEYVDQSATLNSGYGYLFGTTGQPAYFYLYSRYTY